MNSSERIIVFLLILQIVSTIFLWTLDALNQISEAVFALFLAVDLVSFAMISYMYRVRKQGDSPRRGWLLVGCAMMLILLFSSFLFL
jgi:RsiW-degrading membrane proteinase PrsW (M82 family)